MAAGHHRLRRIDNALRQFFGPSYGAGTRLDDETVTGTYPPQLLEGDSLAPYRERIAGDDALYEDYLTNGNSDDATEVTYDPSENPGTSYVFTFNKRYPNGSTIKVYYPNTDGRTITVNTVHQTDDSVA